MRIAKVENGVVAQVLVYPDGSEIPEGWLDGTNANVGWTYENGTFVAPPPPPAPVPDLTFAQLLIGLVSEGWITEAEGEAWLAGTLPAPVLSLIATLPAEQQFAAKARAISPSVVIRTDPLVVALGAAQGKTDAELDAFFTMYARV